MPAALKSGLSFGLITFLANLTFGVLLPICAPICGIFWGAGAGFLAVRWSNPAEPVNPARSGAVAGAIAGLGGLIGLLIGMVFQFSVLGGQELSASMSRDLSREFGLPVVVGEQAAASQWLGLLLSGFCLSLVNLALMAVGGAAGAYLYAQTQTKSNTSLQ